MLPRKDASQKSTENSYVLLYLSSVFGDRSQNSLTLRSGRLAGFRLQASVRAHAPAYAPPDPEATPGIELRWGALAPHRASSIYIYIYILYIYIYNDLQKHQSRFLETYGKHSYIYIYDIYIHIYIY